MAPLTARQRRCGPPRGGQWQIGLDWQSDSRATLLGRGGIFDSEWCAAGKMGVLGMTDAVAELTPGWVFGGG